MRILAFIGLVASAAASLRGTRPSASGQRRNAHAPAGLMTLQTKGNLSTFNATGRNSSQIPAGKPAAGVVTKPPPARTGSAGKPAPKPAEKVTGGTQPISSPPAAKPIQKVAAAAKAGKSNTPAPKPISKVSASPATKSQSAAAAKPMEKAAVAPKAGSGKPAALKPVQKVVVPGATSTQPPGPPKPVAVKPKVSWPEKPKPWAEPAKPAPAPEAMIRTWHAIAANGMGCMESDKRGDLTWYLDGLRRTNNSVWGDVEVTMGSCQSQGYTVGPVRDSCMVGPKVWLDRVATHRESLLLSMHDGDSTDDRSLSQLSQGRTTSLLGRNCGNKLVDHGEHNRTDIHHCILMGGKICAEGSWKYMVAVHNYLEGKFPKLMEGAPEATPGSCIYHGFPVGDFLDPCFPGTMFYLDYIPDHRKVLHFEWDVNEWGKFKASPTIRQGSHGWIESVAGTECFGHDLGPTKTFQRARTKEENDRLWLSNDINDFPKPTTTEEPEILIPEQMPEKRWTIFDVTK